MRILFFLSSSQKFIRHLLQIVIIFHSRKVGNYFKIQKKMRFPLAEQIQR